MQPSKRVVTLGGETYAVNVTWATHERIKMLSGVSLGDLVLDFEGKPETESREAALANYRDYMGDNAKLIGSFYAAIKPQLDAKNISREAFDELIDGKALFAIGEAMTEALLDFLACKPEKQRLLMNALRLAEMAREADEEGRATMLRTVERRVASIKEKLSGEKGDRVAEAMIQDRLKRLSGNLPESLASILGD